MVSLTLNGALEHLQKTIFTKSEKEIEKTRKEIYDVLSTLSEWMSEGYPQTIDKTVDTGLDMLLIIKQELLDRLSKRGEKYDLDNQNNV